MAKKMDEAAKRRVRAGRMLLSGEGSTEVAKEVGVARQYLDGTGGHVQVAFLPPYSPDLNPVEYLWAWLKRHALANFCPDNLAELQITARSKLKSAQRRPNIIAACWKQAGLF